MIEQRLRARGVVVQVIHAHGDDPQRAGDEQLGTAALHTVARHVLHLAMKTLVEPGGEPRFGGAQIDVADTELLETEFAGPVADACLQCEPVDGLCGI